MILSFNIWLVSNNSIIITSLHKNLDNSSLQVDVAISVCLIVNTLKLITYLNLLNLMTSALLTDIKNLSNILTHIKIAILHQQSVSTVYRIPNPNDDSLLSDKPTYVKNPPAKKEYQ